MPSDPEDPAPTVHRRGRITVARNRVLAVHLDDIVDARGEGVRDFVVVEPLRRSASGTSGVAILPVVGEQIVLLHIYRHAVESFGWEVPRGFVEATESAAVAARRELEEETGLTCAPAALIDHGRIEPEPGILAARTHLFVAPVDRPSATWAPREMGHHAMATFTAVEALAMVQAGEIREAATLLLLTRWVTSAPPAATPS